MRNTRVLFLCHPGWIRSRTAAEVFAEHTRLDTDFAGTGVEAVRSVSANLIAWADTILVMENRHRKALKRRFGENLRGKYVRVLGIPDEYDDRDPILIALLRAKVPGSSVLSRYRGTHPVHSRAGHCGNNPPCDPDHHNSAPMRSRGWKRGGPMPRVLQALDSIGVYESVSTGQTDLCS